MIDTSASAQALSRAELMQLGAIDNAFFSKTFFAKTVRMAVPAFHLRMWQLLESSSRLVNLQVFRDGAKTTLCRIYTAKRVAYGTSRTILYVGKSEAHAARSVRWIRRQVETNRIFTETFGLRPGKKWQDTECEIYHQLDELPITILALGITGSTRGVNIDDYRPDLIVVDDVVDEENSATPEQRKKVDDLLYGALKNSLAPASEAPDAKMVMLQTPLNRDDVSVKAFNDPEWQSARFGCWTADTEHLPAGQQESVWPERYSTAVLRREKELAAGRNQLSVFLREKECRIVSPETSAFRASWLRFYDFAPEGMQVLMAIDPVPPPSEKQIASGLRDKDYEAIVVAGRKGGDVFLLEYVLNRGHDPSWTTAEFFRLALKWRPQRIIIESIAYQRVLSWLLRRAMEAQRIFFAIEEYSDRRSKSIRIVDALNGLAANGKLWIRHEHTDFLQQFTDYPDVNHDDLLDATAIVVAALQGRLHYFNDDGGLTIEHEADIPALTRVGGSP